ncbi:hypothetical protein AB833_30740 [Chromatiales bacterium (ex Bugula neritina AB1)]|nr:hypothetical protein AB833_30740 [Chromatiales bacterium (ex Bugula neritina AB1)]
MSNSIESTPILVVDTSTAMLHVLKSFADKNGYEAECYSGPANACSALGDRFQSFDSDYRCVIIGWPEGRPEVMADLLTLLRSPDHRDLPLIIVSQELNEGVQLLVKRRPKTRALLWKDYQQAAEIIDRLAPALPRQLLQDKSETSHSTATGGIDQPPITRERATAPRALLLDDSPSVCHSLKNIMEANGYRVTVASTISEGKIAVTKSLFDFVITDFFLRGESGEEFCRFLQSSDSKEIARKPVCIVVTSKYSDAIIKRSLAVGAAACFHKNESTELLFARIDALVAALPEPSAPVFDEKLFSQILQFTNEPALLLDAEGIVLSLNTSAQAILSADRSSTLIGVDFGQEISGAPFDSNAAGVVAAQFKTAADISLPVNFRSRNIVTSVNSQSLTLITFTPAPVEQSGDTDKVDDEASINASETPKSSRSPDVESVESSGTPESVEHTESDEQTGNSHSTIDSMLQHMKKNPGPKYFALMMDIQLIGITGDRLSVGESEPILNMIIDSYRKLYTKENSLAYVGEGQFVFFIATRGMQDALVLARKLLQITPQMLKYLNNMSLVSHGAVLTLDDASVKGESVQVEMDQATVLQQCRTACAKVRRAGRDNAALVLSLNQYLTSSTAASAPRVRSVEESA